MMRRWRALAVVKPGWKARSLSSTPGTVVGDADGLAVVEDRDDHVAEVGVEQVLDELLDDGVGHLTALLAAVVIGLLGERGDERRQVFLLDGDHARRAGERVVDGDARRARSHGHVRQ